MKKIFRKIFKIKNILLGIALIYVLSIFINQQKSINSYEKEKQYYAKQIETAKAYQQSLNTTKNNINSKEYIEKMARETLDMYLPNEKVYINKNR